MQFRLAAFADEADGRLDGQIKAMKDNGVEFLEIRGVDGQNISEITSEKAKEIKSRLADNGLAVWSLGSPFGKMGMGDGFEEHLEAFKRGIHNADILGAKHIRMFSFYVPSGEEEKYKEKVFERLNCFVEASKNSDIILCHENEKGIYGDMAVRCLEIHKTFPTLKAVFDPANFIQCSQDTIKAWEMLSPYVEYMHIKDAMADGSVVPAGEGIGNLKYLLSQYKGEVLTLEPHLSVFDGFDKLEESEKTQMKFTYPSSQVAFKVACDSLKKLI